MRHARVRRGPTTGRRATLALFGAALLAAAPVVVLAVAAATTPHRTDLKCFWTGARLVAGGLDPYDAAVWAASVGGLFENILGRVGGSPCSVPFGYPLTTAVLTLPLGLLPLEHAAAVWTLVSLSGLVVGVALLARAGGIGRTGAFSLALLLFASPAAWWNSIFLQYGGLVVAAIGALSLPSMPRSAVRSTLGMLVLAMKPHVAPMVLVERAAAATAAARTSIAATLGAVLVVSLLILPSWPLAWIGTLVSHRAELSGLSTTWALLSSISGRPELAFAACVAAAALFVVVVRRSPLRDAVDRMAIAVVAWMLVVPYLSNADFLALGVAWCALLRRAGLVVALVVADLVPWLAFRVDPERGLGLVAPLTAVALVAALRRA